MTAQVVDGTAVARQVREDVATGVEQLVAAGETAPGLATVLLGDDPTSEVHLRNKRRLSVAEGMHRHLPGDVDQQTAAALIDEPATDPAVSGILLQLPAPAHPDSDALLARTPAEKDVDGLTTVNAGLLGQARPCTPSGVMVLVDQYDVPLQGVEAVVVGRPALVGKPMAQLLLERNVTVTICHSRNRELAAVCRRADVLSSPPASSASSEPTRSSPGRP